MTARMRYWLVPAMLVLGAAAVAETPRTSASANAEKRVMLQQSGPDYSAVDSLEKTQALVDRGELVPLLLFPESFGGDRRPENIVYVPKFVAQLKEDIDRDIVSPLAAEGKITRYVVEPEYAGKSFVPIALHIRASDPGDFRYDLAIWGEALTRKQD